VTEPDQEPLPYHTNMRGQRAGSGFLLTMLGLLLLTILLLNTGVLEASYSGIAFMGLLPFVIGALVTGAGLQVYSHYGCIIAPVLLFAIMFPLVHYGLAEGLICIIMVLPFWLAAGIGGALATYVIHRRQRRLEREEGVTRFQALGLAALPFALLYAEEASPPAWEEHAVVRHVDIAADARDVWPLLLSIPAVSSDEGIVTFTHDIAGIPRLPKRGWCSAASNWCASGGGAMPSALKSASPRSNPATASRGTSPSPTIPCRPIPIATSRPMAPCSRSRTAAIRWSRSARVGCG
jgi:hypothetical protein